MSNDGNSGVQQGPPKRKLRNFLLDTRFQLKYTGYVVGVALVLSFVLGYFAIDFSREASATIHACNAQTYADQPDALRFIEEESNKFDLKVTYSIVGGLTVLIVLLALTGIVVTHKVVGPAYKLRRLLREVGEGRLRVEGRLRKGDELHTVFEAFDHMLKQQRAIRSEEVKQLERALEALAADPPDRDAVRRVLHELRDRIQSSIEGHPGESSASLPVPAIAETKATQS